MKNKIITAIFMGGYYVIMSIPNHFGKWSIVEFLLLCILSFLFNILLELEDLNKKSKEEDDKDNDLS